MTSKSTEKLRRKKLLPQPASRFAELSDDEELESGRAFEDLLAAPVCTSSFTFKSEKKWTWDASQFSDHFSIDVNHLSRIFKCIPFNEYVQVDEKYFNKDELTSINSSAELARRDYAKELELSVISEQLENKLEPTLEDKHSGNEDRRVTPENANATEAEEDLDFLLSLKEPLRVLPANTPSAATRAVEDSRGKTSVKSTKSIDLEEWLNSVLDE